MNKKIIAGCVLLAAAMSASATPITYTLENVIFSDGATATGSFTFDADTHLSSAFSISTTAGILSAFTWNKLDSGLYFGGGAGPNNFTLITTNGQRVFNFSFTNPLTNAGGVYALNQALTYECYNCNPYRRITSGTVTSLAAQVPEPATPALLLGAGAALALLRRRQRQQPAR
ncbi:PEP-CTERM sorting domain-containing protein [Massilia sp. DWR3-1-1]|uniref:PEP-CTERM sorting domain-containing protein n=1 Tax=Massilia sp. DWR3-1-1 TaxID=2804559 RepID=UPI003CF9E727